MDPSSSACIILPHFDITTIGLGGWGDTFTASLFVVFPLILCDILSCRYANDAVEYNLKLDVSNPWFTLMCTRKAGEGVKEGRTKGGETDVGVEISTLVAWLYTTVGVTTGVPTGVVVGVLAGVGE